MIKISKDLNVYDFRNEFEGLDNTAWADEYEALGVLYNHLAGLDFEMEAAGLYDGRNFVEVRDWLRFQVMEMTAEEIKENYSNIFTGSSVEDFLIDHTELYGTYESDGIIYYLFSEF